MRKKIKYLKLIIVINIIMLFFDQSCKIFIKTHFIIGENFQIFSWFFLTLVENPGMLYGLYLVPGYKGTILLVYLRCLFSIVIFFWIYQKYKQGISHYFLISISLICTGAISNMIDGAFYGILFNKGIIFHEKKHIWIPYTGIAHFQFPGYSCFMGGSVVDIFYLPFIDTILAKWIPFFESQYWKFFQPVFNLADTFIAMGGVLLFLMKKKNIKTRHNFQLHDDTR